MFERNSIYAKHPVIKWPSGAMVSCHCEDHEFFEEIQKFCKLFSDIDAFKVRAVPSCPAHIDTEQRELLVISAIRRLRETASILPVYPKNLAQAQAEPQEILSKLENLNGQQKNACWRYNRANLHLLDLHWSTKHHDYQNYSKVYPRLH